MKKFLLFYFLFSFFFLIFFASGFIDSLDGFQYLAVARRIYYDHTFEMPKESFAKGDNVYLTTFKTKDGKIYSPTGLGYSLAMIPAVVAEDIFTRLANVKPYSAFPLKSDWPVLLFASFTNAFFGALLVVTMYLILKTYQISHNSAVLLSFLTVIATNLFPYTKHALAHMMFISFLMLSFYFIRRYLLKQSPVNLFFAGLSYGVVIISYNQTYLFAAPPLALYYLLLNRPRINLSGLKILLRNASFAFVGILPFFALYRWFDNLRFEQAPTQAASFSLSILHPPLFVFFEGIWNLILSPGRGFLIYSPVLLIIFLFWFKLRKNLLPEIVSFGLLAVIYIYFIGTLLGGGGETPFLVWHGEWSWGPRYVTPIIPFAMILVANIYSQMSRLSKILAFLPLVLIGLYIQLVGVFLPYQIKFAGFQPHLYVNNHYLNVTEYANIIPRFSPIFTMSKTLIKRIINLNKTYDHGIYNVRLFDGFEYPFDLGYAKWRGTKRSAFISFDNNIKVGVSSIDLQFRNHIIDKAANYPADLTFTLNGTEITKTRIQADQEVNTTLSTTPDLLKPKDNILNIASSYEGTDSAHLKNRQVLFLQILKFNDQFASIETIDYPYLSPVSQNLFGSKYYFWGNQEQDPFEIWDVHSGVWEQTFDLWWVKALHYWDLPKNFFITLFVINIGGIIYFGYKTFRGLKFHQ